MRKSRVAWGMFVIFVCAVFLCGVLFAVNSPVFSGATNYTLYLGRSSSERMISTQNPSWDKLVYKVRGESGEYEGDRADELQKRFGATLVFFERVCGVENYYCYSPYLGEPIYLNGHAVNLHLAVKGDRTAAGTPLIFGGY